MAEVVTLKASMEVNMSDRLVLLNLLPPSGNIATMRLVREIQKELPPTEEELESLKMGNPCISCGKRKDEHNDTTDKYEPNTARLSWIQEGDKPKTLQFGRATMKMFLESFKEMDKRSQLSIPQLEMFDRIVAEAKKMGIDENGNNISDKD